MADLHRKRRGCHWASSLTWDATPAANVNLHGASPWHPKQHRQLVSSNQRETPPDKPGASSSSSLRVSTALGSVVIAQESRCVSPTRRCRARLRTAAGCPRLVRGRFTFAAKRRAVTFCGCHRLARWRLTFLAICFGR